MTSPDAQAIAERALCGLVGELAQQIDEHIRVRASTLGLTAPQANALRELAGPMTMRDLAERLSCEPSNATFIVDKLEKQGLIERCPHPSDRRAKQLVLTRTGTELREQLLDLLMQGSPLANLGPGQQDALRGLLERAIIRP
jgi:DNA-binding MarR family transcriptional regulator